MVIGFSWAHLGEDGRIRDNAIQEANSDGYPGNVPEHEAITYAPLDVADSMETPSTLIR